MLSRSGRSRSGASTSLKIAAACGLLFLHLPLLPIFLYAFTTEEKSYQFPPPGLTLEWFQLDWAGQRTDVGLVRPDEGTPAPHPVLVALPWGAGTPDLVYSFLDSYWAVEPPSRGYYVVSPSITGSYCSERISDSGIFSLGPRPSVCSSTFTK